MDKDYREVIDRKALEKVNFIMATVLEYMNTNYKPVVFDKHCVGCFPQCPNSRVDLRKNKALVAKYGKHVVNEAFIIADTDVPGFVKDDSGVDYIRLWYIISADKVKTDNLTDKIKADLLSKGLDAVVLTRPFVCGAGSVIKVDLFIEY